MTDLDYIANDIRYIRSRLDTVAETQAEHSIILEENADDLAEHIRRTEMLEEQMETALLPIKIMKWAGAVIGVLGTAVGIAVTIKQLF